MERELRHRTEVNLTRYLSSSPVSLSAVCVVSICVSCVHAWPREFGAFGTHATRSLTSVRRLEHTEIRCLLQRNTDELVFDVVLFRWCTDKDKDKFNSNAVTAAYEEISSLKPEIAHLREELSTCVPGFQSPCLLDFLTGLSGPVSNMFISFH